jgi:hypothetical protein
MPSKFSPNSLKTKKRRTCKVSHFFERGRTARKTTDGPSAVADGRYETNVKGRAQGEPAAPGMKIEV